MTTALTRVFQSISIGSVTVGNRVAQAAHGTGLIRGSIGEDFISYHLERARGGCGLAILEGGAVHPSSFLGLALFDEGIVDGYRRLMDAIRPVGMRVFQQLWHGGNIYPAMDGSPPWTVSEIPGVHGVVGSAMTLTQIAELRAAFVTAAQHCQRGNLDGIELIACHGYLFHQFLSPSYNTRTDQYGGTFENRSRFLVEVMEAIRSRLPREFAVGVRLGAGEFPDGVGIDDNRELLSLLQSKNLIDYVDLSVGDHFRMDTMVGAMQHPAGYELESVRQLGAIAKVPKIVTGRIRTLEEAEQILRDGDADIVSLVRAQVADPELVNKTREGRVEQVRPCIGCNQGCIGGLMRTGRTSCTVNAAVGRELTLSERLIAKAEKPKRVLIVGGGPAGMESARVAALAGHEVTLVEAQASLGGAAAIARQAPRLQGLGDILDWLEQELYRLKVDIRLGTFMDAADVGANAYDVIVIATGAEPRAGVFQVSRPSLRIKGENGRSVVSSRDVFTDRELIAGARSAVVYDAVGHYEALATCEFLVENDIRVTHVTGDVSIASYVQPMFRDVPALERLYARGTFESLVRHELLEIEPGKCKVKPIQAPASYTRVLDADLVVAVTPNLAFRGLYDELRDAGVPASLYLIGDARGPRDLQVAIAEGHNIARSIH